MRLIRGGHPEGSEAVLAAIPGTPVAVQSVALEHLLDSRIAASVAARLVEGGLGSTACRHAASIVASELATNVVKHGSGGRLEIRLFEEQVQLLAYDRGAGIAVPELAFQDGYSQDEWVDPDIRRLGYGLGAVLRLMDDVAVYLDHPDRLRIQAARTL